MQTSTHAAIRHLGDFTTNPRVLVIAAIALLVGTAPSRAPLIASSAWCWREVSPARAAARSLNARKRRIR